MTSSKLHFFNLKNLKRVMIFVGTCALIIIMTICELTTIFVQVFNGIALYLNWAFVFFLAFNMIGNFIACFQVDSSITSIKHMSINGMDKSDNWRFCEKCGVLTPPRSKHCDTCNICILRKDHHCYYIGRCIGHFNYRYFLTFLFYVAIATTYATSINIIYFLFINPEIYADLRRVLCFAFPILVFLQWDWYSLDIFLSIINAMIMVIACSLLHFHIPNLLTGATCYERGKGLYDLGSWRRNVEMAFGKKFYMVWLSPFVRSKLPHDGVHWKPILGDVTV